MKAAAALGPFHALHPVSALSNDGIDELRNDLISLLPEGPMYYPVGTDTDMPLEARIAELVREQALHRVKEELPHAITAEVVEMDEKLVHVRLYTETESQKQILIGKGGSVVRDIGRGARPFVEKLVGHKVYLQIQVKASPKWRRNQTMLERLGL
jgi:GTP-binding protein Era